MSSGRPKGEQAPTPGSAKGKAMTALPRKFAPPTLEADRVTLRPLLPGDVYALFGFFSDHEVTRYWSRPPMTHLAQARTLLRQIRERYRSGEGVQLGIERKDDGALVGTCTLFHFIGQKPARGARLRARIAVLAPGLHARGAAAAACVRVRRSQLIRLEADIDPRNEASERTLLRLGFIKEGYMRERWIVGDVVSDSAVYGLLRREWTRP